MDDGGQFLFLFPKNQSDVDDTAFRVIEKSQITIQGFMNKRNLLAERGLLPCIAENFLSR